jgi:hypothetical protein
MLFSPLLITFVTQAKSTPIGAESCNLRFRGSGGSSRFHTLTVISDSGRMLLVTNWRRGQWQRISARSLGRKSRLMPLVITALIGIAHLFLQGSKNTSSIQVGRTLNKHYRLNIITKPINKS